MHLFNTLYFLINRSYIFLKINLKPINTYIKEMF